jgi:uncharacterized protein YbaR (Trm112 family)
MDDKDAKVSSLECPNCNGPLLITKCDDVEYCEACGNYYKNKNGVLSVMTNS